MSSPRGAPRDSKSALTRVCDALCVAGTPLRGPITTASGIWVPNISAFTRVFDALCAGTTVGADRILLVGPFRLLGNEESLGLHGEVHLVLKARILVFCQQLGVVRDDGAQRLDPRPLVLGEVVEHVGLDQVLQSGMPDADAHAPIVVTDMRRDRAQPVVAGDAATGLEAHLAGRKVD